MTIPRPFNVTEKKCATCSFWSGLRIVGLCPDTNKPVYVSAQAEKSYCKKQENKCTKAEKDCPRWQMWHILQCTVTIK